MADTLRVDREPGVARTAALASTLGLAAAGWTFALRQPGATDMRGATPDGAFAFVCALWVPMTAAMMLPGVAPEMLRRVRAGERAAGVLRFVGAYLAVWTSFGAVAYAVYRPHQPLVTGAVAIAAGLYECTPLKAHVRRGCRAGGRSGFAFGLCCVGSCAGLMLMQVALDVMSVVGMVAIAAIAFAQKRLPAQPIRDVPLGLAIAALGVFIAVAPPQALAIVRHSCGVASGKSH